MIWGLVGLVIQSDMSPKAIVQIWGNTTQVFTGFHVPIVDQKLIEIVHEDILTELLSNLNNAVGSSSLYRRRLKNTIKKGVGYSFSKIK